MNDIDRRFLLGGLAGAAGVSALSAMARGGPLSPPAGSVGSTGKTLAEVEPRTALTPAMAQNSGGLVFYLPSPGSYYLTGDITVPSNYTGVFMLSPSTLDLNGFSINGTDGTGLGVRMVSGCTVRNGRIRNLLYGVEHCFSNDADTFIEDLYVSNCPSRGIMANMRAIIRRCAVAGPSLVGIECTNDYALIEDCVVSGATGTGIYINSYSTMRGCKLIGSGSAGGAGGRTGFGSRAERCTFEGCAGTGLNAGQRSSVDGCSATGTTGSGIGFELSDGAELTRSVSAQNVIGIRASTAARIIESSAEGCSASGLRLTGSGNFVESCRLMRNTVGLDMTGTGGNYVQKSVILGNTTPVAVTVGGNTYPTVTVANTVIATNPCANIVG